MSKKWGPPQYGSNVKGATYESFSKIQAESELRHRAINKAILDLALDSGASLPGLEYEASLTNGLQTDAIFATGPSRVALEFHHKAKNETTNNKVAIYILEKLKEYAVNFGLADR